jgi:pilus assembly protein TadC
MTMKIIFLEEFGKAFVPKRFIPNLRSYVFKAGLDEVPYKFFGLLFYISAMVTTVIFITFIFPTFKKLYSPLQVGFLSFVSWFGIQLTFAFIAIMIVYFYFDLRIYHRTKKMEEQLPDFLEVLSANLKGGMTFERALWAAIKPRFSVLGNEMAKASKKVMTGYEVKDALIELTDKYDSLMLKRTVDLMVSEFESGGNVSELIDRLVKNLKQTKALKDEMSASAIAYVIFISVIVILVSPLLFALSYHLLSLVISFIGKLSGATSRLGTLPISFSSVGLEKNDFRIFSVAAISVISLFSSMIVSIVEKDDIKGGIKYIPLYMLGSISVYFILMKVLATFFGGII